MAGNTTDQTSTQPTGCSQRSLFWFTKVQINLQKARSDSVQSFTHQRTVPERSLGFWLLSLMTQWGSVWKHPNRLLLFKQKLKSHKRIWFSGHFQDIYWIIYAATRKNFLLRVNLTALFPPRRKSGKMVKANSKESCSSSADHQGLLTIDRTASSCPLKYVPLSQTRQVWT